MNDKQIDSIIAQAIIETYDGKALKCEACGAKSLLDANEALYYSKHGWPRCCGYTMKLYKPEPGEFTNG